MRRLGIAVLVVVGLVVGASCTYKDEVPGNLKTKAAEITDDLADHDWKAVRDEFDDDMKDGLSEKGLEEAWDKVVDLKGRYQSRGKPAQVTPAGIQVKKDHLVFDTPLQFAKGAMKSRITFHRDGKIAGLFILIPSA
jgi:hypothetical protein